jgi:hypothetical protein
VGEDFAQRHSMYYLETSAKEAENVERLFMEIAAELMEVNTYCIIKVCSINKFTLMYCILNDQFIYVAIQNRHMHE